MKIKKFYQKHDLEICLLGAFVFIILVFLLTLKFGGASELPKQVEKNGFCRIVYGNDWRSSSKQNVCFFRGESRTFTELEFRETCPRVKLFSLKFNSDCFHKGRPNFFESSFVSDQGNYQGAVPLCYDEEYFRESGITQKLANYEECIKKIKS